MQIAWLNHTIVDVGISQNSCNKIKHEIEK